MTLNISGSGGTPPLVGQLIENASASIEKLEQAVSLPQQNGAVKFSNGGNAELMPQMTAREGAAQPAQQDGLMQKLLMLLGLQQLLGGGQTQPAEQTSRQPENSAPAGQSSSSGGVGGVIQQVMQMMQQLMQMIQQVMGGKGAQGADGVQNGQNGQPATSARSQPEAPASGGQSQGGVNGLVQQLMQMMQQLMQIMQQLAGGGQKSATSGEGGNAESNGAAQPAQQQGGNMLSKLLGPLLQMVGLDALMSKLGGTQNNGG
ncbi:hypothetical protein [Serratia rubidaea]|uniref:hypothetical protein n=1 Tax=Serratia rubidaea TaxID=61652 RepID=UPI0022B90C5A|nr:hypothetical protein [Serratia rubidaea]WBF46121.1 hypothetical protein OLD77_03375 [Serratia rubidaea]